MRINGQTPISNAIVSGRSEKSTKAANPEAANPQDETSFSSASMSIASLAAQALQTPEIRQDRVASLKAAISNGTYAIEPGKIADAMLNH
jgi:negative regulator of flagellin synthesis FlgM